MKTVAYKHIIWLMAVAAVGCSTDAKPSEDTTSSVDAASPSADNAVRAEAADAAIADAQTVENTAQDAGQSPEKDAGADASAQPVDAAAPAQEPKKDAPQKLGRAALGSSPLPCELRSVLETSCQGCHAHEPGALAPMALTSREDLLAPAISQPMRSVYELVKERIHSDDAPMPPASSRRLTEAELATLDNGLNAEISVGPETCEGTTAPRQAMYPDPDPSEIEQCYPMHAYQVGDMTKPFRANSGEMYGCFAFDIPWEEQSQAVSIRIEQSPIVHHWILFDGTLPQGTVLVTESDCSIGGTTVYASGGVSREDVINAPPSVGLLMPSKSSGKRMQLSIHYFNGGEARDDTFGVDICIARKPRENTAVPHTVGTYELSLPPHQATEIVRHCKPNYTGDIHLIQTIPHMHSRATRYSTIIERANGTSETLIDIPFDFNNQITYGLDSVLKTGDSLTITCYFQNDTDRTIIWGTSTDDEMCGGTITAWPAGSLSNGNTANGVNTCIE